MMKLLEFVNEFDKNEKIRVILKEETLYEGKVDTLRKLLNSEVVSGSGKHVDNLTQINVI